MRHAFAKALRRVRKTRGLTQEDFAPVSSRTYLSSLERGRQSPTLDKLQDLSQIIGLHPLSLLTLTYLYLDEKYNIDGLLTTVKNELDQPKQSAPSIRLLIADDHAILRAGLKNLFSLADDIHVVAEAANGDETVIQLAAGNIDVLLLDMTMPGLCGRDLIALIRCRHPELPILVLSVHIEPPIAQAALDAGATGYISKDQDPEILLNAIRTVANGKRFIDPKMADCVNLDTL